MRKRRAEPVLALALAAATLACSGVGVVVARGGDGPPAASELSLAAAPTPAVSVAPAAHDLPTRGEASATATASALDRAWYPNAAEAVEAVEAVDGDDAVAPVDERLDDLPVEPEAGPEPEIDGAAEVPPQVPGRTAQTLLPELDLEAVEQAAQRTGIPSRALAAYASTALRLAEEQPDCNLTWVTLAGIGWVESHHGRIGGRQLQPDGLPSTPIIGVPLDGGPGVRAIPDSDGGRWDGDDRWDRAVGPMQFIPSTWRRWKVDATGSGEADPQNIDDAALAAGRYLCVGGRDLSVGQQWGEAIFSYNRSAEYVHAVLRAADTYAARASDG